MNENANQETRMIEMTYCGEPYHDQLGYVVDCGAADGPCRRCLRTHITHLEAALVEALAQAGGVVADDAECFVVSHDGLLLVGSEKARAERHNVVGAYFDRLGNLQVIREGSLYDGHLQKRRPTLPASRVLGEGEAVIGPQLLQMAINTADWMAEIVCSCDPTIGHACEACCAKALAVDLRALRTQPAEGGA